MADAIRVGTRPSRLALKQAEEIIVETRLIASLQCGQPESFQIICIKTAGDKDKKTSLQGKENTNFFTYELERALLNKKIDIAVHSAKDLTPDMMPQGLVIAVLTKSISRAECLVSKDNVTLEKLPSASRIGTSSHKRKEAVLRFRPDFKVVDIRGDIDERLKQLKEGKFDAIIVAHAAMIRLGYQDFITQIIPEEIIRPHPLQGSLAVQARAGDKRVIKLLASLRVSEFAG